MTPPGSLDAGESATHPAEEEQIVRRWLVSLAVPDDAAAE